jgi:hypothetical protein
MVPNTGRVKHYAAENRQAEFAAVVQRVLPRSLAPLESVALCLSLCALWGLVLYVALTSGL